MGQIVVDASVALKWVLDEPGSTQALAVLDSDVLHAPEFLLVEVANVFWAKQRRGIISRAAADAAFEAIAAVPFALAPIGELTAAARTLAFGLDLTVYDALYAALAQRYDCPLVTADRQLAQAMNASGMTGSARLIA